MSTQPTGSARVLVGPSGGPKTARDPSVVRVRATSQAGTAGGDLASEGELASAREALGDGSHAGLGQPQARAGLLR